jgi:two-component system, OmpR family, response regulator
VSAPRLLLVEDQVEVARALRRVFSSRGFAAEIATSCAEARALAGPWDCAVLDVDLPDGSGIDLAGELRRDGGAACVVFYSAQVDPRVQSAAEVHGPFVNKRAGSDELVEMVQWQILRAGPSAASGTFQRSGSSSASGEALPGKRKQR